MVGAPACAGCKRVITEGGYITFQGLTYHERCFCCDGCRTTLLPADSKLASGQGVHSHSGRPYCGACWTSRFAERCGACNNPFESRERVIVLNEQKLHPACFRCAGSCGVCLGETTKYILKHDLPYCATCHADAFGARCDECHKLLGTEKYVQHKGRKVHRQCFTCHACAAPLALAEHYEREGKLYCADDYRRHFGVVCALCDERLLKWITGPTGETYCPRHEKDSPACHGCGRLVPSGSGGVDLSDGRVSCRACAATAVCSLDDARAWYGRVRDFLVGKLGVAPLPEAESVHLNLVERSELLARSHGHLSAAHRQHKCPVGLTSAEELVTTRVAYGGGAPPLGRQVSERTIGGVLVLKGLPAELCAATLAHELGHVYMHLAGFDSHLPPAVCEGMCELIAYLWLTAGWPHAWRAAGGARGALAGGALGAAVTPPAKTGASGDGTPFRVKAMMDSTDAVYGQGFRDALAAYYALGSDLPRLLAAVKAQRGLPAVPAAGSAARLGALRSARGTPPTHGAPSVPTPTQPQRPAAGSTPTMPTPPPQQQQPTAAYPLGAPPPPAAGVSPSGAKALPVGRTAAPFDGWATPVGRAAAPFAGLGGCACAGGACAGGHRAAAAGSAMAAAASIHANRPGSAANKLALTPSPPPRAPGLGVAVGAAGAAGSGSGAPMAALNGGFGRALAQQPLQQAPRPPSGFRR